MVYANLTIGKLSWYVKPLVLIATLLPVLKKPLYFIAQKGVKINIEVNF